MVDPASFRQDHSASPLRIEHSGPTNIAMIPIKISSIFMHQAQRHSSRVHRSAAPAFRAAAIAPKPRKINQTKCNL